MPKILGKYLSSDYYTNPQKSFINYLQTAIRYPLRDLRKKLNKVSVSSLDAEMGDGGKKRSDMMSGDDYEVPNSYNDYSVINIVSDDAPYSPEIGDKLADTIRLNYKIYNLINYDYRKQFFYYKIIGVGGNEKVFGKTYTHQGIMNKYLDGSLDAEAPALKENIDKKAKTAADRFFYGTEKENFQNKHTELLQKFQLENPESFDENKKLIVTNSLIKFLLDNAKGTKETPLILLKRIRREIQEFFERNKELDSLVINSGLINPKTNKPFSGMEYLNNVLKSKTAAKPQKDASDIPSVAQPVEEPLNEDMIYEKLLAESEDDEAFSFRDMFDIAKATAAYKKNIKLQEVRKIIKNILFKNL
jgi:hypothetical protein